jgi:hypothetical protein
VKSLALLSFLFISACLWAQSAPADAHRWLDSFAAFKESIRPLEPAAAARCEEELHAILKQIDDNGTCSADTDCTLVNQDPFGATVPVRAEARTGLLSAMRSFKASCDNDRMHSNMELAAESAPTCHQGRCWVKLLPRVR